MLAAIPPKTFYKFVKGLNRLKFIPMEFDERGGFFVGDPPIIARYVRADLFDELTIEVAPCEDGQNLYFVQGVVYSEPDKNYEIESFDAVDDAKKFLCELLRSLK